MSRGILSILLDHDQAVFGIVI
jgi:hypothetical protein